MDLIRLIWVALLMQGALGNEVKPLLFQSGQCWPIDLFCHWNHQTLRGDFTCREEKHRFRFKLLQNYNCWLIENIVKNVLRKTLISDNLRTLHITVNTVCPVGPLYKMTWLALASLTSRTNNVGFTHLQDKLTLASHLYLVWEVILSVKKWSLICISNKCT